MRPPRSMNIPSTSITGEEVAAPTTPTMSGTTASFQTAHVQSMQGPIQETRAETSFKAAQSISATTVGASSAQDISFSANHAMSSSAVQLSSTTQCKPSETQIASKSIHQSAQAGMISSSPSIQSALPGERAIAAPGGKSNFSTIRPSDCAIGLWTVSRGSEVRTIHGDALTDNRRTAANGPSRDSPPQKAAAKGTSWWKKAVSNIRGKYLYTT